MSTVIKLPAESDPRAPRPGEHPAEQVAPPAPAPAAASGDVETRVTELWTTVLGVEHVGPDDNFFDRGGNSLKLIRLHARLCKSFGVDLPVQRLFEISTVRAITRYLLARDSATDSDHGSAQPAPDGEERHVEQRGAVRRSRIESRKEPR